MPAQITAGGGGDEREKTANILHAETEQACEQSLPRQAFFAVLKQAFEHGLHWLGKRNTVQQGKDNLLVLNNSEG